MKAQITFATFILMLVACAPRATPRSSTTPIAASTNQSETNTPALASTATVFVNPMQIPTPINTPHGSPTLVGQVTQQESFDLYGERIGDFENNLRFTISVLDISAYTQDNVTLYIIRTEGVLTNISRKPVIVPRTLRSGFTMDPEVYWEFSYNQRYLEYIQCCVDGWLNIDQEDFVILQPNEFQRYTWAFSLPMNLRDSEDQEITLSGKLITITAVYINSRVGFSLQDERGHVITERDDNGDMVFFEVDMNAWVGRVDSNSIGFVFP